MSQGLGQQVASIQKIEPGSYVPGKLIITLKSNSVNSLNNESSFSSITDLKSDSTKSLMSEIGVDTLFKLAPSSFVGDTLKRLDDGSTIKIPDMSAIFLVKVSTDISIDSAITLMKEIPDVIDAEPDYYFYDNITEPDDDLYEDDELWHLNGTYGVQAPEAWDNSTGDGTKIAIVEINGVLTTHDDLDGKYAGGETSVSGDHGTMVASMAAAETDNSYLVASIGWDADFLAYNTGGTTSGAITDINSASSAGADIINMSWGGESRSGALVKAFVSANANGVALFASAGNSLSYPSYSSPPFNNFPASYNDLTIAVSANNSYGDKVNGWNYGSFIDFCAPGYNLTVLSGGSDTDYEDGIHGTSFSSPLAAGVASLLLEYDSSLKPRDIEHILQLTANDIEGAGYDNYTGYGIVDAEAAIDILDGKLLFHGTASNGTDYDDDSGYWYMYGLTSAPDGLYAGDVYEVRKSVTFGPTFSSAPEVWGRMAGTAGYKKQSTAGSIYGFGYCEPVPETITTTGVTLRTYVYDVVKYGGGYSGWYPCNVSNATFAYTAFGTLSQPSVTISGPTYLYFKQSGTFSANISGGSSPFSYQWYKMDDGDPGYTTLGTSSTQIITMGVDPFTVKVVITDNYDLSDDDTHYVDTGLFKLSEDITGEEIMPEDYSVDQNYPNPFNPETQIRFGLPDDGKVTIEVYNLQGKKVATLANGNYNAGYHSVSFDGSNFPSGVYFYKIVAGDFTDIKRMLLIK